MGWGRGKKGGMGLGGLKGGGKKGGTVLGGLGKGEEGRDETRWAGGGGRREGRD